MNNNNPTPKINMNLNNNKYYYIPDELHKSFNELPENVKPLFSKMTMDIFTSLETLTNHFNKVTINSKNELKNHLLKDDFVVEYIFLIKMKLDNLTNYIKKDYKKNYKQYTLILKELTHQENINYFINSVYKYINKIIINIMESINIPEKQAIVNQHEENINYIDKHQTSDFFECVKLINENPKLINEINLFEFIVGSFGINPILLKYVYYNNLSKILIRNFIRNNIK